MAHFGVSAVLFTLCAVTAAAASADVYFRAIRANDLKSLGRLVQEGDVNQTDARGAAPLHYAALVGSVESVKLLVSRGADVNSRNTFGATPLVLAASNPEKVRILLAAGADPGARTKIGRTALIIAAGRSGAAPAVRRLLDAGAELEAADENGTTPLVSAALTGDEETVRLLLARGASARTADKAGLTVLMGAPALRNPRLAALLISKGADVNAANTFGGKVRHGLLALTRLTPLILAAPHSPPELVRTLVAAGAKVNARDGRGMTPLMAGVASQRADPETVRVLIDAGAEVNATDGNGDSVLDWARKFGHPSVLEALEAAGATGRQPTADARAHGASATAERAAQNAVALLQRSGAEFFKQSGCTGCHHQPVIARAEFAARAAGVGVSDTGRQEMSRAVTAARPVEPMLLQFIDTGGDVDTAASLLAGAEAANVPASSLTDAAVNYIAGRQERNGSWSMPGISRVPFEDSDITRTALAIRSLRAYGWPARQREFDERVARAKQWLLKATPRTSYERADLLLGLYWAGASETKLASVARALAGEQRADGGWAQNPWLAPDAYATGLALYALHTSGRMKASDAAYQRGVKYLLDTQREDGSWHVRSRAPKFQPYFQSGFPHDHDQWISSTATAYAVMALAPAARGTAAAIPSQGERIRASASGPYDD